MLLPPHLAVSLDGIDTDPRPISPDEGEIVAELEARGWVSVSDGTVCRYKVPRTRDSSRIGLGACARRVLRRLGGQPIRLDKAAQEWGIRLQNLRRTCRSLARRGFVRLMPGAQRVALTEDGRAWRAAGFAVPGEVFTYFSAHAFGVHPDTVYLWRASGLSNDHGARALADALGLSLTELCRPQARLSLDRAAELLGRDRESAARYLRAATGRDDLGWLRVRDYLQYRARKWAADWLTAEAQALGMYEDTP